MPSAVKKNPWQRPGRKGEALSIEDFPSLILTRLGAVAKWKITKQYVEPFGLSLPEWLLIAVLARFPAFTHRQIRDRTFMDKGQVSTTLRTLIARGLVATRSTTTGRANGGKMILTPRGKALYRRILPAAQAAQMTLLQHFNEAERARLYALLRRMLAALDAMNGPTGG